MPGPLNGLQSAGWPSPPKPKPNIWNTASGGTDPVLDRAVIALQRENPADLLGVDIRPMAWTDRDAGTMTMGSTELRPNQFEQTVRINPAATMAFPPALTESTLAHELEHVRQNRALYGRPDSLNRLLERGLPYLERPREKAARTAEQAYRRLRNLPDTWISDPAIFRALPLAQNRK